MIKKIVLISFIVFRLAAIGLSFVDSSSVEASYIASNSKRNDSIELISIQIN